MNIQEFRQKYPQYKDMSDNDLAESFYQKYYADMPKEEFMSSFVGTPQTEQTPEWAGKHPNLYGAKMATQETARTIGKAALNFVPNVATTAYDIGKTLVTHPIESAKTITLGAGALPVGLAERVIDKYGGETGQKFLDWFGRGALTNFWQPFESQLKKKYGSYENFKQTIETRPAEAMFDLSLAMKLVGKGMKAVDKPATVIPKKPITAFTDFSKGYGALSPQRIENPLSIVGNAMEGASSVVNPLSVASNAVTSVTSKIGERAAPRIYESALKIPPSVPSDIRDWAVKTGLEGKYKPTDKGLTRLRNDIQKTNIEIANAIDTATQAGKQIDMANVVTRVDKLKEFYNNLPAGRAKPFIDDLNAVQEQYLSGGVISPAQAQKMKQTIYALNRKHYGEMKTLGIEADKAVARGLKEELVAQHPELQTLNAKDSAMINLEEILERSVNRLRNYDIVRFSDTIAAIGGGALAGPPGAVAAGGLKAVLGAPGVKASIAFALDKAAKKQGIAEKLGRKPQLSNYLYQTNQIQEGREEGP